MRATMELHDALLREHVAAVLRRWDPLGVEPGVVGELDEYDGYASLLSERIEAGATVEALTRELGELRAAMMAERGDAASDLRIARELLGEAIEPLSQATASHASALAALAESDEGSYVCPHCSEEIVGPLDPTAGELQRYVEDCPVCCHPIQIEVEFFGEDGPPRVSAEAE